MAQAIFVQNGNMIDYTPGSAVAAGDVIVQGLASNVGLVGIAPRPIPANASGSLLVRGAFQFLQDAVAKNVGDLVYWNTGSNVASKTASTYALIGKVIKASLSGDATVTAKLDQ